MHEYFGGLILVVGVVACGYWLVRPIARSWDKELLPPREAVVTLPPAAHGRHPRLELEFHQHRLLGFRLRRFGRGSLAGWSLHLGLGFTCLCVDWYRRGRRP